MMKTRCPYPTCAFEFDIGDSERTAVCPGCARRVSCRDINITNQLKLSLERRPPLSTLSGLNEHRRVAVLEDIRSMWNVGSIFRSADGAGFTALLLCGITAYPPRKEIEKTSLGAEEYLQWRYYFSVVEALKELAEHGFCIVGLERIHDAEITSRDLSEQLRNGGIKEPLALVVGNEVTGLSPEVLEQCNFVCDLPMKGQKESLNVAVAFGIASYLINERVSS